MEYVAICKCCPTIADCKAAFGKYWIDKSDGGKGCRNPFAGWGIRKEPVMPKMPRRPVKQTELI